MLVLGAVFNYLYFIKKNEMKKIFLYITMYTFLNSCSFNLELSEYDFDNFKDTPLWELAKAIRADDAAKTKNIVIEQKVEIDLKDPLFKQTLLTLAIVNNKRNSFLELLDAGANSNVLVGNPEDSTPFINAIQNVENCDLFFVENMLNHGANPNLEIKNPQPEYFFMNSFPLLVAIGNQVNPCLDLIKLLVDNGADINCCYQQSYSDVCEGVLAKAITLKDMETLKFFVIEKNITIPDTVIIFGEVDKLTQKAFSLREVLNERDYTFEDFERDGKKYDRSKQRKIRNEILEFLDIIKK